MSVFLSVRGENITSTELFTATIFLVISGSLSKVLVLICLTVMLAGCYSVDHPDGDVLSPHTVLANKDLLLNRFITVRGTARADLRMFCTLMACPEENPCCNICGAALQLCDSASCLTLSGTYSGTPVRCSGNECGELTCFPLEQGVIYQVDGIWQKHSDEEYSLELHGIDGWQGI